MNKGVRLLFACHILTLHLYVRYNVRIEVIVMQIMNATNFRQNMYHTIEQTVKYNEPVCITGKSGNAVLLSEEDYNDLIATMELCAVPGMQEKIVTGMNTTVDECLSEDEVKW